MPILKGLGILGLAKGAKAIGGFFKGTGGQVAVKGAGVGVAGAGVGHGIQRAFEGFGRGTERVFRSAWGQEIDEQTGEVRHNPLISLVWIVLIVGVVLIVLNKLKK